jgi:glyoxylase I family protein
MVNQIAHVCISSLDLDATKRFYCEGLGFRKVFDFIREGNLAGYYLGVTKDTYVEVFRQDEVDTQAKSPVRHFCLEVDSIDDISKHLTDSGYEVSAKKLGADESYQAWVTDPAGVRIEFHEYTEKSFQITGDDCILG